MNDRYEYAIVEWVWDAKQLRTNLPGGAEKITQGSYAELVEALTELGREGWETATCAAAGNWLFWTLRRVTRSYAS